MPIKRPRPRNQLRNALMTLGALTKPAGQTTVTTEPLGALVQQHGHKTVEREAAALYKSFDILAADCGVNEAVFNNCEARINLLKQELQWHPRVMRTSSMAAQAWSQAQTRRREIEAVIIECNNRFTGTELKLPLLKEYVQLSSLADQLSKVVGAGDETAERAQLAHAVDEADARIAALRSYLRYLIKCITERRNRCFGILKPPRGAY